MKFTSRFALAFMLLVIAALGVVGLWTPWIYKMFKQVGGQYYAGGKYGLLQTCTLKQGTLARSVWNDPIDNVQAEYQYECLDNLSSDKQLSERISNGVRMLKNRLFHGDTSDFNNLTGYRTIMYVGLGVMLVGSFLFLVTALLMCFPSTASKSCWVSLSGIFVYAVGAGLATFATVKKANMTNSNYTLSYIGALGNATYQPGWGLIVTLSTAFLMLVATVLLFALRRRLLANCVVYDEDIEGSSVSGVSNSTNRNQSASRYQPSKGQNQGYGGDRYGSHRSPYSGRTYGHDFA